jgi:hypothetical protein
MDFLPAEISLPAVVEAPITVIAQPSVFRQPSSRTTKQVAVGATLLDLVIEADMG